MIQDPEKKKELDEIPDADENGDAVYKIDDETGAKAKVGDFSNSADDSEFKDTPQDLKDESSQE